MISGFNSLLVHYGFDAMCRVISDLSFLNSYERLLWIGPNAPEDLPVMNIFDCPFRAGAVIDRVAMLIASQESDLEVNVGPYTLRATHNLLEYEGKAVKITDTEKRLLFVLFAANGQSVSRDDLLDQVWGMRPDLDTHTVETHIYRLRQKIENNPSEPKFLMTVDDGYILA